MTLPPTIRNGPALQPVNALESSDVSLGLREISLLFSSILDSDSSSIESSLASAEGRGFSAPQMQRLQQVWGREGLTSLRSLAQEDDSQLLFSDMMSLAADLRRQGRQEGAGLLYAHVVARGQAHDDPRLGVLTAEAQQALQVLRGAGPLGAQLEFYSEHFLEEAFHPATLGGMALGQLAFAPVRHGVLHALWNRGTGRFALGSLGSRFAATGVGLAAEVPIFWGASKGIQSWMTPGSVSWDGRENIRELAGLALTLGVLRLTGFGAQSSLRWIHRGATAAPHWALGLAQRGLPTAAAIGGLYLAHGAQEQLGWRDPSSHGARLLDATVVFFQFGLTGRLAHGLLGPRFQSWNQSMEARLQQKLSTPRRPGPFSSNLPHNLAMAPAGGVPEGLMAMVDSKESFRPIFSMTMDGETVGSRSRSQAAGLIGEVLARGRSDELLVLKDILLEVYQDLHKGSPSERIMRRLTSQDPEDWKLAITVLATGEGRGRERLQDALVTAATFQEFEARWRSRPHYLSSHEVPVQVDSQLKMRNRDRAVLEALKIQLARSPDTAGITEFLQRYRVRYIQAVKRGSQAEFDMERLTDPEGNIHVTGHVDALGLQVIFNSEGIFQGPIRAFPAFSAEQLPLFRESLQRGIPLVVRSPDQASTEAATLPPSLGSQDISVEFVEGTPNDYTFGQTVRKIQERLAASPDLSGARAIFDAYSAKSDVFEVIPHDTGAKTVLMNRGPVGLVMRFDIQETLILPLEISGKFSTEALELKRSEIQRSSSPQEPIAMVESEPSVQTVMENALLPMADERPIDYTYRLMEASRSPEDLVQFKLVQALDQLMGDEATRSYGTEILQRIRSLTQGMPADGQAVVRAYDLPGLEKPLEIFSPVTTFLPEDWSIFFAQKVSRWIESQGGNRERVAELGSGTGWLSVYLRARGLADYVEGGDRTDTAPLVSRINAQLNGVDSVRFVKSDLWSGMSQEHPFDLVVACIPQIPLVAEMITQRGFADYAPHRENVMRPFGLGLIHDALTESLPRLRDDGRILLNLAGRPGLSTLLEMYRRTGYHPIVRDSEIIAQDPDTDIAPLAALEAKFPGVRFEFLPPEASEVTALLSGREAVDLRDRQDVTGIRHRQFLIEGMPYRGVWEQVMSSEQVLPSKFRWSYTHDAGTELYPLRQSLARQLSRDWGLELNPDLLFIVPEVELLADGILRLRVPNGGEVAWVGELPEGFTGLRHSLKGYVHREVPWEPQGLLESLQANEVYGAVVAPPPLAWNEGTALNSLIEAFAERGRPLILVEPYGVRAAARPEGPLTLLAQNPKLAANTVLLQDLQTRWQGPLSLGVGMIADPQLFTAMSRFAELTYSRSSTPVQRLYLDLLQRLDQRDSNLVTSLQVSQGQWGPLNQQELEFSGPLARALEFPAVFSSGPRGISSREIIDMSFGESEWQPSLEMSAAWEWARRHKNAYEEVYRDTQSAVQGFLRDSRRINVSLEQIVLGYGVHPLLARSMRYLGEMGGPPLQVFVPQGSYGLFYPTAEAAGARMTSLATSPQENYLVTPHVLEQTLRAPRLVPGSRRALLINTPTNPAGRYYSPEQLAELAEVMRRHRGILLFDDIFGLLHHQQIPIQPQAYAARVWDAMGENGIYFGGVSKEFAAGGLRLGWALTQNLQWARALSRDVRPKPDILALSASSRYMQNWRILIPEHQNYLAGNRRLLTDLLQERHIDYHETEGGYSLLVDFSSFFRQQRSLRRHDGTQVRITPENLSQLLYEHAGIKVNDAQWSQTPGRYRFVFSIDNMELAVERLRRFFRSTR